MATTAEGVLSQTQSTVTTLQQEAKATYDKLKEYATLPIPWFDFANTPVFEPQRAEVISTEDLPTLELVVLKQFVPDVDSYVADFTTYIDKVNSDIITGGTGIGDDVQTAIFDNGIERLNQATFDALTLAEAKIFSKGHRHLIHSGERRAILIEYENRRADLSRDIVKLIAERAQQNIQFAVSKGVDIQNALAEIWYKSITAILRRFEMLLQQYKIQQDTLIAEYEGKIKAIQTQIEVYKVNGQLELAYQSALLKKWEVEAQLLVEKGKADIQQLANGYQVKMTATASLAHTIAAIGQTVTTTGLAVQTAKG